MSLQSAVFGTLSMAGCTLLLVFAQRAQAVTEPPRTNHQKPWALGAAPVELPSFRPGLWQYRRTVTSDDSPGPRISMLRKCADPSAEIRKKLADLGKRSCQFAPLAYRRNRYVTSWTCPTPLGRTSFRAVLIVRGTAGYTDVSEMRTAEHLSRQKIEAIRIGECPASGPGAQFR